ncbi:MAG: V-type ATP synthase subunit D [Gallicola sp.]|nr:V-type ATP synthase subunit D [Gallicola sp.]
MINNIAPTKANYLKLKESLTLSKTGYNLIDKKRTVLIKELLQQIDMAKEIQTEVNELFAKAYLLLQRANISMGVKEIRDIATSIDKSEPFEITYRSIMGLDVPNVKYVHKPLRPHYSLFMTSPEVDEAIYVFRKVKHLIYRLAQTENTVYKLSVEIKKNQKRANALEKIKIPEYEETIKYISDTLEEKEREEFFRLKKMKKKKG